jgi:hypothetical protein
MCRSAQGGREEEEKPVPADDSPDGDATPTSGAGVPDDSDVTAATQPESHHDGPSAAAAVPSLPPDEELELERLRAENARLSAAVTSNAATRAPARGRRRMRRWTAGFFAGLTCLLIVLSSLVVWSHQTILNTDTFVSTVAPVIKQPAVADALAARLTHQVQTTLNLQKRVSDALPSSARAIVPPVANAVRNFIQGKISEVLQGPRFYALWEGTLRFAHTQVIAALEGKSSAIRVSNGEVVLNVLPMLNQALQQLSSVVSGLVGHQVHFPTITSSTIPESARNRLSQALGVPIPSDFGNIVLVRSSSIETVTNAVSLFNLLTWLLPLVTAILLAATIWLSLDKRRTLLQVAIATIVLLVVIRRLVMWVESHIIHQAANQAAASGIFHQLLGGLFSVTVWMLVVASLAAVALAIAGPYAWARWLRTNAARLGRRTGEGMVEIGGAVVGKATANEDATRWVINHRTILQAAGAVLGAILLLVLPFVWFLVVAGLLIIYEVVLARLSLPSPPGPELNPQ